MPQLSTGWLLSRMLMPTNQSRAWANWFRFLPPRIRFPDFCYLGDIEQYVASRDVMKSMLRVQSLRSRTVRSDMYRTPGLTARARIDGGHDRSGFDSSSGMVRRAVSKEWIKGRAWGKSVPKIREGPSAGLILFHAGLSAGAFWAEMDIPRTKGTESNGGSRNSDVR